MPSLKQAALYSAVASLAYGFLWSSLIALFALRRGSLSPSGGAAAVAIGTSIYAGGGPAWFAALVVFFASSTAFGKLGRQVKAELKRDYEKGDTRDAAQALANGGMAALCALGHALYPHPIWSGAFLGALATANGDTWATEIGVLSRARPLDLRRLRRVPRGSSGAVSTLGLVATVAGGLAVGVTAACAPAAYGLAPAALAAIGAITGGLGALVDSGLGASVQASYHCSRCDRPTEAALHACGERTTLVRGWPYFGNDAVNLTATATGALLGSALVLAWR